MDKDKTIARIEDQYRQMGELLRELRGSAAPSSASGSELFDPRNPTHLAEVNALFQRHQISQYRQSYFLRALLTNVRMQDLPDIVDKEDQSYKRRYPRQTRTQQQQRGWRN